jgi:cytochrome P450
LEHGIAMSMIETSRPVSARPFRPPAPPRPDGPIGPLSFLIGMWRNPLATWSRQSFELPFVQSEGVLGRVALLNEPAAIRHVFVDNAANYRKDALQLRVLSPGLGNGLLTAEGDEWRAQRRALAPLFTPRLVDNFEPAIIACADWLIERWTPLRDGRRLDVSTEMSRVTLEVLQRTIFPEGLARDPADFARAMSRYFDGIGQLHPFDVLGLPKWAPRVGKPDTKKELRFFADAVADLVAERRKSLDAAAASGDRAPPRDLLGLLLTARDPQTGAGLSEPEINANIVTFIGAGHETTASALTWSLYLLSQHPDWRAEVEAEVDAVIADGFGAADAIDRLIKTRATFEEALRLYPPAATLSREAIGPDVISDRPIRAGDTVIISPWVVHRHKLLWSRPDDFVPQRFMPGQREAIDRFAYIPFGAGPRVCIGMGFAMREAVVILASILRHFRLDHAPGHDVTPRQRITLRPKGGMPMILRQRGR